MKIFIDGIEIETEFSKQEEPQKNGKESDSSNNTTTCSDSGVVFNKEGQLIDINP